MRVESAIELVRQLIYKPGWDFTAEDARNRFENAIRVRVEYPAHETAREDALQGYPHVNRPYASFFVLVGEDCDDITLYRRVMKTVLCIEEHEAREYFRVQPTGWAPFHPHQIDGMKRWNPDNPEADLYFGAA